MRYPQSVRVVEVGPRDGLQSLPEAYPTDVKVEMVRLLAGAGLREIEVTSFVRPDVIPQLADAEELLERLGCIEGVTQRALVPNRRGAERAAQTGVDELGGLIAASESYSRKNSNMTIAENLEALAGVAEVAREAGKRLSVGIAISMFCPYEGEVPPERVLGIVERLVAEGVGAVMVASSVGMDAPRRVGDLCTRILDRWPDLTLGVHLHTTNGMALANALAAIDAGATVLDAAVCGFGGGIRMPYGIPHFGNLATEDLVQMLAECGVETGVDLDRLLEAGRRILELLGIEEAYSHALRGGTKANILERGRIAPRDR